MNARDTHRERIRSLARLLGVVITECKGGLHLRSPSGRVDFRVRDLADVLEEELTP